MFKGYEMHASTLIGIGIDELIFHLSTNMLIDIGVVRLVTFISLVVDAIVHVDKSGYTASCHAYHAWTIFPHSYPIHN